MIEYIMVSGVLMALLVVMLLLVNSTFMETPVNRLSYVAFTDIGNGISTRIVDVYALAPSDGSISTVFDIPDDVADKDYFVQIGQGYNPADQDVQISRGLTEIHVSLAGIGASRGVVGNTTGRGLNRISYDSGGY
ncbi:MAG: hypothetical protein CVV34_06275 [Methanomicrobiales archaeon HGW-Methanomicrobiales-5]|nr:MAG: hypothetical protein CVV34_06275 [Methanomicrobiales archaeon HGW-Methanomicrobiales-5]